MSENKPQNISPSKLIPTKERIYSDLDAQTLTPAQLERAVEKHKLLLDKYKESKAALIAYKDKTANSIAKYKKILETEQQSTESMIHAIIMKNESSYKLILEGKKKAVEVYKSRPLLRPHNLHTLRNVIPSMKQASYDLKNEFHKEYNQFIRDFNDIRQTVMKVFQAQSQTNELQQVQPQSNSNYLIYLQKMIEAKFSTINRAVNIINYQRPNSLSISNDENSFSRVNSTPKQEKVYQQAEVQTAPADSKPQIEIQTLEPIKLTSAPEQFEIPLIDIQSSKRHSSRTPPSPRRQHSPRVSRISQFLEKFCQENAQWLDSD